MLPDHLPPLKLTYLNCTTLQLNHFDILLFKATERWREKPREHPARVVNLLTVSGPPPPHPDRPTSIPISLCTEISQPNQKNDVPLLFLLRLLQDNRTSPRYRYIYISFLDLTYNHNWSPPSSPMWWFEEHSDVPVYQTSRAVSPMIFFVHTVYHWSPIQYSYIRLSTRI